MSSEAEKIRRMYEQEDLAQREIADRMGLTQSAISKKMKRYGINSDYSGFWTEEEIEKLKNNYKEISYKEVNELFPNRSWNAIKLKAMELNLATPEEEYRHSEERKEVLSQNSEDNRVEVDFGEVDQVSYVLGVIDGGYHDNSGAIGLETISDEFASKFVKNLEKIGLNPNRDRRRNKERVWASSESFVSWLNSLDFESKFEWLDQSGDFWSYIEGAYDSDGDFSNPGPRICSYDEEEKEFLKKMLSYLGLEPAIHTNNVYIPVADRERFFENVDPVYDKRKP